MDGQSFALYLYTKYGMTLKYYFPGQYRQDRAVHSRLQGPLWS